MEYMRDKSVHVREVDQVSHKDITLMLFKIPVTTSDYDKLKYFSLSCGLKALESKIMSDLSGVSPVKCGNETLFDDIVGRVLFLIPIVYCHIYYPDRLKVIDNLLQCHDLVQCYDLPQQLVELISVVH